MREDYWGRPIEEPGIDYESWGKPPVGSVKESVEYDTLVGMMVEEKENKEKEKMKETEKITALVRSEPKEIPEKKKDIQIALSDMERMAEAIAKSGLFGLRTPDQALALMLISQAEGRHPALAARDYNIIQGKVSKTSEAVLRDFLEIGGSIKWFESSDTVADAEFNHPQGGSLRIVWDMKRAELAGLAGKQNWRQYPRQMLRARCISEGVRAVAPMATSGMYVPEEVAYFGKEETRSVPPPAQPPKNVTPKEKKTTPKKAMKPKEEKKESVKEGPKDPGLKQVVIESLLSNLERASEKLPKFSKDALLRRALKDENVTEDDLIHLTLQQLQKANMILIDYLSKDEDE